MGSHYIKQWPRHSCRLIYMEEEEMGLLGKKVKEQKGGVVGHFVLFFRAMDLWYHIALLWHLVEEFL